MNNSVFIPIEITSREYISKLLLSIELIKKGMPVIIGHKSPVIKLAIKAKDPGILFYKSTMAEGMESIHKLLKDKKFGFVAQDEEAGIVYEDFKDFYKKRTSMESIDEMDIFFSWGEDDYNFLNERSYKNIVKNCGALRACLWGDLGKKIYENEVININKKYGDYILLASNLVKFNSYLKKEEFKNHLSQYKFFNLNEFNKTFEVEKKIFYQYIELIKFLTKKLKKKVIVRPHPSESKEYWEKALDGIKNVFVERKGEILTWILASKFVIQNNCTSAIEASTVNKPVITYFEEKQDLICLSEGKENIPNKLSIPIQGKNKLIENIENINFIWNEDRFKEHREMILSRKLKNYGNTKAAEAIAQEIINYTGLPNPKGNENLGKDSIFFDIYELLRTSKLRPNTKSYIMDINKREVLTYNKIKLDIDIFLNFMGIKEKIRLKRIGPSTFYLYPLFIN